MPNWCNNTLKITGDSQQIERLPWKDIDRSQLKLFQSLLPCPDGLNGQEQYDWALRNWGVKWDCFVEIVDTSDDYIELQFDTLRNAPHKGIDRIATMFPLLNFYLQSTESVYDWQGSFSWSNGKLIEQINGTYYAESPSTCPECHSEYFPEIDLYGEITYHRCFECAWSN
ncbi:MAG: hypothetical protein KME09_04635 [Pleurocapsa minor HA4230-MV1]|jgi:hypothetical protein|nr:hypothetical protein [Pleurocapsa minor HA4230-MV1]